MSASTPRRSLTRQTLIQVALRITVVVVVATVIGYFHVSYSLQVQVLEQLEKYIQQRAVRESNIFLLAKDNLSAFAAEYARRVQSFGDADPKARFEEFFVEREDGSTRLREGFFSSDNITGIINKYAEIDADLRRRLMVAFEMLAQYGPAWQNRFVNLYVITPENAVLMYWPGKPWGLSANSWEVNAKLALSSPADSMVVVIDENPRLEREATWSDLYFDYAVNNWMVSVTEPVNLGGQYLLSIGHDMLLHELIERTINNRLEGTYNLIFRDDGRLIAHPRFMDAIQAHSGRLSVLEAGDPNLLRIFNLVKKHSDSSDIIDNSVDNEYLAVGRLQGPGWHLVTVFPKAIIAERAFQSARLILLLGAVALLLEIIISFFVLKKQVAKPLTGLMEAADRVATGNFDVQLDEQRPDEIGQLARSLNTMAREINARETALNERSAKLALLNEQLEQELEDRKRAEQEIARQREALHQSEKLNALGSLLAGVAHELNNPLSIVVGRAILMEKAADPNARAAAKKIRQAAERCAGIVKTFLAIARRQPPERMPAQLNALVESAVELVGYGLRTTDIDVSLELAPDLPELSVDSGQLMQVFTNLIVNAQQALAEVPVPRRLTIATCFDQVTNTVRIAFTDNGPGVPTEIQARIFEPFFTSKPVGIGTGIGLSFSYGVVESHGGKITLENPDAGGARFVITLPIVPTAAVAQVQPTATETVAPKSYATLVVDDEPEIAEMLGEILTLEGHRVTIAASGNEALKEIEQADYDVILSDLKMPDLDGRGLYNRLQQSHPHLLNRIVFITGDTLGMGASDFLAKTGCPLIEKPFLPGDIVQAVRQVLKQLKQKS